MGDGLGMASNLARVGGICFLFAVTFALGGFLIKGDHRSEEEFRTTIAGRLNPKVIHAQFRAEQEAGARFFRFLSRLLFVAGCVLLVAAGIVILTR